EVTQRRPRHPHPNPLPQAGEGEFVTLAHSWERVACEASRVRGQLSEKVSNNQERTLTPALSRERERENPLTGHQPYAMQKSLDRKLAAIHADPSCAKDFILADAKDADMAFGIGSPGRSPEMHAGEGRMRTLAEYRENIRQIT